MTAIIEGFDRSSAEYLKALEDELSQSRITHTALQDELETYKSDHAGASVDIKDPTMMATLKLITDRLSQVEVTLKDIKDPTSVAASQPPLSLPTPPPVPARPPVHTQGTVNMPGTQPTAGTPSQNLPSSVPTIPGSLQSGVPHVIPAHAIGGPLTAALQRLGSTDPQLGRELDPYTYVLATKSANDAKLFDRSKMDLNDLFYGWMKVATNVMKSAGDIRSYLSHLMFCAEMYHSRKFSPKGPIDYDAYIINRVATGAVSSFGPDTIGASLHFSPNVIYEPAVSPSSPPYRGRRGGRRNRQYNQDDKVEIPSDFPPEICYLFNYRSCTGNCGRNHVCRVCRGKHDARSCQVKKA